MLQVPSFESDVRKEQWEREQAAKQLARETKVNLKDVNMAVSLHLVFLFLSWAVHVISTTYMLSFFPMFLKIISRQILYE